MLEYRVPTLLRRDRVSGGRQRTIDLRSISAQAVCEVDIVVYDLSEATKDVRRGSASRFPRQLVPAS